MTKARNLHSWLSRHVFFPWIIYGPWTASRRQFLFERERAYGRLQTWEQNPPEMKRQFGQGDWDNWYKKNMSDTLKAGWTGIQ